MKELEDSEEALMIKNDELIEEIKRLSKQISALESVETKKGKENG